MCRKLTLMLAVGACIGLLAAPAMAQPATPPDYVWDHPCADDPVGTQTCDSGQTESEFCWCQGEWNEEDHWASDPDGYPDQSTDAAAIHHSNTGYCDGGTNDGDPCSENGDCSGGTCDNYEDHLKIDMVTETINSLEILVDDTNATDDALDVRFNNIGVCDGGTHHGDPCDCTTDCPRGTCVKSNKTLNVGDLYLDADNGPLTIKVIDTVASVLLKTDTTD